MPLPVPWRVTATGLVLSLRVTPNGGADRIEGVETRDDGSAMLRLRVRAPADRGKANAAVIVLLAEALGLPRAALTLLSGATARQKTVAVSGDAAALALAIAAFPAKRR